MDYSRAIYLIGRSHRQLAYDQSERAEIIAFIVSMAILNPCVRQVVRLENTFSGFWMQSDVCLGKNLQRICKFIKYRPLTADERTLCDSLFEALWNGRWCNGYTKPEGSSSEPDIPEEPKEGMLEVNIDGIDTGFLQIIVDGIGE